MSSCPRCGSEYKGVGLLGCQANYHEWHYVEREERKGKMSLNSVTLEFMAVLFELEHDEKLSLELRMKAGGLAEDILLAVRDAGDTRKCEEISNQQLDLFRDSVVR